MIAYEDKLRQDLRWGFLEGSMHFEQQSAVHKTIQKITKRLDDLAISYALVGGMAMFFHGYQRFTVDVGLLVTPEGLKLIHERLEGRGYLPLFTGSKHLRDTDTGVRVEFLTTGDYPGDGKPKPVAFPDPATAAVTIEGIRVLGLEKLIELKLASGMTNPLRGKDLVDVQEMIALLKLPENFGEGLDPFVREKYREIWILLATHPQQPE